MEVIGIGLPTCACTHNLFIRPWNIFNKKRSCFRPQPFANFQLDRKLQGRAFLVPNDAVSTR